MTGGQTGRREDEPTQGLGTDGSGAPGVEIAGRQTLEALVSVCLAADKGESPRGTDRGGWRRKGRDSGWVGPCLPPHKACSRTCISKSRFLGLRCFFFFSLSVFSLTWECLDRAS